MKNLTFHKNFQLNGVSFTSEEELLSFSKTTSSSVFSFLSDWFNADDFVVVQTSGSTGKPKPIPLKKKHMVNSAKATGAFFDLKENTKALLCLSTDYIAGKMMLVRALTLGWRLDIVEAVSNPLEGTDKEVYDFSAMVPLQLQNSLEDLHKVKKLIVGGGVVSNDLIDEIQNLPTQVFATYGMTETITHIAVKKLNNYTSLRGGMMKESVDKEITSQMKFVRNDECYKALPNIQLSQDSRNCLVIDAPKVSTERIVTNDVVHLVSETEFEWLGRYDNVINSGGVKLHPEKIEEKLSKIITNRFFVIGIPDKGLGEKLVLIVEGVTSSAVEKSLKTEVKSLKKLSKYEIPKEIYFVDKFIETETKKIQRKKTLDLVGL
ncbi:AMP-binding protein [Tenacibaculum caenipelagi]|uniref:O-succinylbenzoic acid--CoA ligase n=1 Tax=Tenacibaculum caenipelagi TaxID=1325435 RepID=A0A4R6TIL3_9FLAO|nr:AMP-binding protein [Tenacibaculum caenipelagi]TDQ27691.1 O-succinylbenzoic acid--CoA ligase [Tenacibaculum caenipelagi]